MAHQFNSFLRHVFRHDNHQFISSGRADGRQSDTRISRSRFDKNRVFPDQTGLFGLFNHFQGNSVLYRKNRIVKFTLGQNIGLDLKFFRQPRQINQRRPADHFRNRIIYLLHFAL